MGVSEIWRNRKKRLRFTGFQRNEGGEIEVSFTGNSWTKLKKGESVEITNPQGEIYARSKVFGTNGKGKLEKEEKLAVSGD